MECTFQVGDRVVCVDNTPPQGWSDPNPLSVDAIYSVVGLLVSHGTD